MKPSDDLQAGQVWELKNVNKMTVALLLYLTDKNVWCCFDLVEGGFLYADVIRWDNQAYNYLVGSRLT